MSLLIVLVPLFGLVAFAAAAIGWGADSRDGRPPDREGS
jgi:hypothetical protein